MLLKIMCQKKLYPAIVLIIIFILISLVESQEFSWKTWTFDFCTDQVIIDLPNGLNYSTSNGSPCKYIDKDFNISYNKTVLIEVIVTDTEGYDPNDSTHIINAVKAANAASPENVKREDKFLIDGCEGVFEPGRLQAQYYLQPQGQQILGKEVYVAQYMQL